MPPIPIYSSSPINASKASGVTPKTAEPDVKTAAPSAAAAPTPTKTQAYAPAQPGAVPVLPIQTATAHASSPPPPAPTRGLSDAGPPPPQPGAVPTLPGTSLPPPPKAGETYAPAMPPQMSMPPPTSSYASYQGTSTATNPQAAQPTYLGGGGGGAGADLSHPPGYHQNTGADQLTSQQRHQVSVAEGRTYDGEAGVWDQAKKWATGVGDSLAAAETEVWRRINKQ